MFNPILLDFTTEETHKQWCYILFQDPDLFSAPSPSYIKNIKAWLQYIFVQRLTFNFLKYTL